MSNHFETPALSASSAVEGHLAGGRVGERGGLPAKTAAWATWAPANPPEWVELLPAGEFSGRDGRGPFRVGDPAAVIAATCALRMEAGIPIDYDHATDLAAPRGRPAPAAGWIRDFSVRGGSIWGRVEWTEHGAAAIRTREYRYISPVFQFARDGEVVRLLRAGLTNNPNLYLTAISTANSEDNGMEELLSQLRTILGISEDANADEIVEKIRQLAATAAAPAIADESVQNARELDPAKYVAMAQFQHALTELNALRAERRREKAERAVDEALRAGKLIPAQREWANAYCQADFKGFNEFIGRQPALLGEDGRGPRLGGEPAGSSPSERLTPLEVAVCSQLGVQPEEFLKRKTAQGDFLRLNKFFEEKEKV